MFQGARPVCAKIAWSGRLVRSSCLALIALHLAFAPAAAQTPDQSGITSPSIATSLPNNGDPGGVRAWFARNGLTFNFIYTNDVLANVHGGLRTGTIDQGKLEYNMTFDFEKLTGWHGLSFYTNIFQITNTG